MALALKIGKSAYDALPADVKKEYVADGSDYRLDVSGYEDPTEIRRARDHANNERDSAKRERDDFKSKFEAGQTKIADLEKGEGGKVSAAVDAKDKEWQTKFDKEVKDRDDKLGNLTTATINGHKQAVAMALATKLSSSPTLLVDHIAKRLDVEIDTATNTPKHHILDANGKRTAGTVDDLEKEVLKNKEYAPILRGTKATGGGGALPGPGGGGAPRSTDPRRPGTPEPGTDFAKMDPRDLAASITAKREAEGRA